MAVRKFKTLLAIFEFGTFAEAAAAVHLTPAAVSQQMKSLEEELGVSLFDRSKRPPELNPIGYALVPKAQALIKVYEELAPSLLGDVATVSNLIIGAVPTTVTGILPKALEALQNTYENLHFRLYPGLSEELYAQVDRGFLDAAIISEPESMHEHLKWQPFAEEPLVVLASLNTKFEDPRRLLETYPFIRFSRRAWVGRSIDNWLRKSNINIHETMELDTLEAISSMVYNNLGVSIVPENCCPTPRELPLKRIPLDSSVKPRVLGVLSRRDTAKFKFVEIFWEKLIQIVESAGRVKSVRKPTD